MQYLMYDFSIMGFVSDTYDALVNGIFESIVQAHDSIRPARIFLSETDVLDASYNRSPTSYLANPAEERAEYEHNVDKKLVQIRFVDAGTNKVFGAFNWFAVHPVSMNNTNTLVSSDNVGYASVLLEQEYNPDDLVGKGKFVGAFASTNLGDVSPNILGPKCSLTGESCDNANSKCPEGDGDCFASGPGKDMFDSTKIIATRVYTGGSKLLKENGGMEITGPVGYILQNIDMPKQKGEYNDSKTITKYKGCIASMGYSFAAGTTDGVGLFEFDQGQITGNPLWNVIRDFLTDPTEEDIECHKPKEILFATGHPTFPYAWQPRIVATQVLKIGDFYLAAVPGEFTTMSGRRLRKAISKTVESESGKKPHVVIAGLSNLYTSYITTFEEYQKQRYEAGSTIYGPHTLTIYLKQYEHLTKALVKVRELLRKKIESIDDTTQYFSGSNSGSWTKSTSLR